MIYWIIYALLGFLEYFLHYFLTAVRIYWVVKGLFCTWLMIPESASGAHMLYVRFIRPLLIEDIQVNDKEPNEVFESADRLNEITDVADTNEIVSTNMYSDDPPDEALDTPKNSDPGHRLLIGQFYTSGNMEIPIKVLENEHFLVTTVKDETEFITELQSNDYSTVWVLSSSIIYDSAFIPALIDFHRTGGAIFLLADNEPYLSHASEFLYRRFDITLAGTYLGNRTLGYQNDGHRLSGAFGQHEIFTGIETLFEGVTICSPVFSTSKNEIALSTLATGTQGNTCIAVFDPPAASTEGRLCLDCGFTKLFINWNAIETARYVTNVSNWLAKKSAATVTSPDTILKNI